MAESTQHTLDRVRPPRVQITYDVEIGDAIQKKELPFVMGVISDLAGKPAEAPAPMKERKFVQVDRDNFNDVMKSVGPRLAFQVDNQLTDEDSKFNVELNFESMEDFDPVSVVQQVEPLRKLFEARQRLSDLRAKLDGNDDLDRLLIEIVENTDGLKEIQEATAPAEDDAE
ncbi:MAG: type VI secretion system contractile sheath small subunit [Gemmatimonadales bacterium]|jgi:type VI secretion system protein ImpB|nr:type VI secretion system contractile sheath small subunit [Gemmatimonadales bacterium]MDG2238826.1 type VI secretion system contractile sheath small subunit [Longimicrobiales bacterium]NCG34060.1 type VI secretion system contractile sheath small subunit [Pseudomonadota bacterium]MBT3497298.1 type VI secretion system contractile sheath small subunit [Gemmatimonadales bacterium]MBT3774765.1 type VI secretion system contractile sheath small subunit [Gemmatimonadales bacterium]